MDMDSSRQHVIFNIVYTVPLQQSFCDSVTLISTFYNNNNYYYVDEFHMTLLTLTFDFW